MHVQNKINGLSVIDIYNSPGIATFTKKYYWSKLSNGLEVIVIENKKVPLATIEIAVKNVAYTEGP